MAQSKNERSYPLTTPTKVYQDDFSPAKGNALQAAVASIFGLRLHDDDVPNFIESPFGYEAAIERFYQQRLGGERCVKMQLAADESKKNIPDEDYDNAICILRGKSPRGDFGHVVVARYVSSIEGRECFEMLHDPHPDETFLDETEEFGWCMFFR